MSFVHFLPKVEGKGNNNIQIRPFTHSKVFMEQGQSVCAGNAKSKNNTYFAGSICWCVQGSRNLYKRATKTRELWKQRYRKDLDHHESYISRISLVNFNIKQNYPNLKTIMPPNSYTLHHIQTVCISHKETQTK